MDDEFVPYVPLKQRRLEKLHQYATQRRVPEPTTQPESDSEDDAPIAGPKANISLLEQSAEVRKLRALEGIVLFKSKDVDYVTCLFKHLSVLYRKDGGTKNIGGGEKD